MPTYTDGDDIIPVDPDEGIAAFYDGGAGYDTIAVQPGPDYWVDLSATSLVSIEAVNGGGQGVRLTAAQFDGLSYFYGEEVALTTAVNLNLSGMTGYLAHIWLSDADNVLTLGGRMVGEKTVGLWGNVHGGSEIDRITGSDFRDGLFGNGGNDILNGGADHDRIEGGAGNDILNGGVGDDILEGGDDDDGLTGGDGNDILHTGNGVDVVSAGAGDDYISAQDGAEVALESYHGGTGYDRMILHPGTDYWVDLSATSLVSIESIEGAGQGVSLTAAQFDGLSNIYDQEVAITTGANLDLSGMTGYFGHFRLSDADNALTLGGRMVGEARIGLSGNVHGGSKIDRITGSDFVDALFGNGGNDTLNGGAENDAIEGGGGLDVLNGGGGNDNVSGDNGDDTIAGGAGNDILDGGSGIDTVCAGDGDDVMHVAGVAAVAFESYHGGAGYDTIKLQSGPGYWIDLSATTLISIEAIEGVGAGVRLTAEQFDGLRHIYEQEVILTTGGDLDLSGMTGYFGHFRLSDADNVLTLGGRMVGEATVGLSGNVHGGAGIDQLTGSDFRDTLYGNRGNDTLNGGADDDRIEGGGGLDVLDGGAGNDTVSGGDGNDTIAGGNGVDTVDGGIGADAISAGDGDDLVHGAGGGDTLFGNAGKDELLGQGGNDQLDGGGGADLLKGGGGADELIGGNGFDQLQGEDGADTLIGGEHADSLAGGGGADTLDGSGGTDELYGGGGKDSLKGGGGKDGFYFNAPLGASTNVDKILDFDGVDDTIFLDRAVFTAIAGGTLAAGKFQVGTAAQDSGDRIVYDPGTGKIYYDADGSGAAAAILFAEVTAGTTLTNADFVGYM